MTILAGGQEVPLALFHDAKGKAQVGDRVSVSGKLSSSSYGYLQTKDLTIATMAAGPGELDPPVEQMDDELPF